MTAMPRVRRASRAFAELALRILPALLMTGPLLAQENNGARIFSARCALCHGARAAGVPGTFPSLHGQIAAFAKTRAGRDYMIMVVSSGLIGEIEVDGVRYNNVMPPQSGLSDSEVGAVLSYLSGAVITANDVVQARARHAQNAAPDTRALRPSGP